MQGRNSQGTSVFFVVATLLEKCSKSNEKSKICRNFACGGHFFHFLAFYCYNRSHTLSVVIITVKTCTLWAKACIILTVHNFNRAKFQPCEFQPCEILSVQNFIRPPKMPVFVYCFLIYYTLMRLHIHIIYRTMVYLQSSLRPWSCSCYCKINYIHITILGSFYIIISISINYQY